MTPLRSRTVTGRFRSSAPTHTDSSRSRSSASKSSQATTTNTPRFLPPSPEAQCRYVGERVATKLSWDLTADDRELEALKVYAEGPCEDTIVRYSPVV
ncbi:hypothetical protein AMK23_34075 [Streptomyces sp. CB02130]|nr:hypothetical protein AMK23_34075 [Streptomyces sp. CB02130]